MTRIRARWSAAGTLNTEGRDSHTTTLLSDGRVLVAGGFDGQNTSFSSAELYEAAVQHALSVVKTGSGGGTVTSSPAGINCGTICVFGFACLHTGRADGDTRTDIELCGLEWGMHWHEHVHRVDGCDKDGHCDIHSGSGS